MSTGTHEVFNQSTPWSGVNVFERHPALQAALRVHAPGLDTARLSALGAVVGSESMHTHARLANLHRPQLVSHDRQGRRIDQVEFHPSYHALMGAALAQGLHGTPWSLGPGAHVERAAAFMLFTELEPSVLCPVSMTYAVTPALRDNPALAAAWTPRLAATAYDPRPVPYDHKAAVTMGMGMTEKQGGSDVRTNTTRALPEGSTAWGEAYRLTGHKWFFSAPMCDAFLVLAQAPGGLTCFLVPRWRPDGCVNPIRIERLKDKLGNHANASAEVEFAGDVIGWRVGDEGRGVPQILAMGALTRLDCALGSAGLMRAAFTLALHHARERMAFGRRLAEHALMKNVLADLALESEAATALALRLARAVDASEHGGPPSERALRRVLTPIAKFWICKRGAAFAQEAMECLGGNGYVEEGGQGVMARIYREMPVNSIWEGAGNIQALDLLRALRSADVAEALAGELAPGRGGHAAFDRLAASLPARLDGAVEEAGARRLARDVAVLVQAALLRRQAGDALFAAFCHARLAEGSDAFGLLAADTDFDALLERALPA
ncbi:MAG TPA: acyl-CoA dehydrogenase family protein [Burkholderiaceae bacterium]|nr:acyl-CoA dehydrogenase family protein [Burkholderiaceae bacterium]